MKFGIIALLSVGALLAQAATRQIVLTWEDTQNPAATTYSVYRAAGACVAPGAFTKLASGLSVKTYTDSTDPGTYCYYATATANSLESDRSNTADAPVKPFPPAKVNVTVTVTVQ